MTELKLAVAKLPKYGVAESGDTVEVVERPGGGLSVVIADGQGSGPAAKRLSRLVVAKAMALIADGARDGAVARAVHDYLFAARDGKVSTALTIVSVDLRTHTLVLSRNSSCPVLVKEPGGEVTRYDEPVEPIGFHAAMKPAITERPLVEGLGLLTGTDGVFDAGGLGAGVRPAAARLAAGSGDTRGLADAVLAEALERDGGRARDDMTVLALWLDPSDGEEPVRTLTVSFPFR